MIEIICMAMLSLCSFILACVIIRRSFTTKPVEKITIDEEIREKLKDRGYISHLMILNDSKFKYNKEFVALINHELHYELKKGKGVVDLKDVMETEITYEINEKNKMRIVSVMPTFDKKTEVRNIKLRLYKESDDFEFNFFGWMVTPQSVKKLKLMIDKSIKEVNKGV